MSLYFSACLVRPSTLIIKRDGDMPQVLVLKKSTKSIAAMALSRIDLPETKEDQ